MDELPNGTSAARGTWSADEVSLLVEQQTLGNDDAVRATHVFGDKTVEVKGGERPQGESAGTGGGVRQIRWAWGRDAMRNLATWLQTLTLTAA